MMAGESYIDPSAVIGEGVYIGRFCVIEANAVIGDGVRIEDFSLIQQGARIDTGTKVGTHSKIGSDAVVGKDCRFTAYCEIRSGSKVGDRVSMGSRCTLSAGTIVEDDVLIKYAFVATDTPDLTQDDKKKTCTLKAGSRYGANVTIMPTVTVGVNSEIGACSQVRHNVPDDQVWFGCPAKYHRDVK